MSALIHPLYCSFVLVWKPIIKKGIALFFRLHCVKKIAKRKEKDVTLLKNRLDLYSDEWRTAQPESHLKNGPSLIAANNSCKPKKNKIGKKEKALKLQSGKTAGAGEDKTANGKGTKKKRAKCDKVTNGSIRHPKLCLTFYIICTRKKIQTLLSDRQIRSFNFAKINVQY